MQRFSGKHVLVTGGARGIGLAVAEAFAREGARLTLFDVREANLAAARTALARAAGGEVGDVTGLFLFLASDEASWITAQVFVIDGGQLAGQKPGRELLARLGPKA
jgi:NAD(P)-dependent dehydrogenase (short-subunit alcohol dehydrogenase family)